MPDSQRLIQWCVPKGVWGKPYHHYPQEFHNQRAIWLAKQYGIDAIGFNAPDLNMKHGFYTQLREKLARVSAVIDAKNPPSSAEISRAIGHDWAV